MYRPLRDIRRPDLVTAKLTLGCPAVEGTLWVGNNQGDGGAAFGGVKEGDSPYERGIPGATLAGLDVRKTSRRPFRGTGGDGWGLR
jgi:hypothetical protein